MKKRFMRMISMLMVMVMTLGMCVTGYADDPTYSITVENSIGGVEYTVYKVFDATYAKDEDGNPTGAVSYTIKADDPWYSLVSVTDSPFTLTASADGSCYVVSTTADSDAIAAWFNAITEYPSGSQVGSSQTGNGGSITFEPEEAGYYLVVPESDLYDPVAVTVDTAAPNVTVADKNQTPGGGTFKKTVDGESYTNGEEAAYTIESYVPTYDGDKKVVSYTFTDTMGAGLTYNNDISIIITGTGVNELDITNLCTITTGTSDVEGETVLTIYYEIEDIEGYPADANITITYTATVNEAADETNVTNSVGMDHTVEGTDEPIPDPGPNPGTHSYVYGFDLAKVGADSVALDGAQFELTDSNGDKISFVYVEAETEGGTGTYEVYDGNADEADDVTTIITVGEANIWGLGAGEYTLTEIVAPDGYNLLESPVEIVIATITTTDDDGNTVVTGWTVTVDNGNPGYGSISDGSSHGVSSMPTVSIVNNAGSTLPGTGGIGTTIFYVVGTLLVLAAAALVVAKMRLGKTE